MRYGKILKGKFLARPNRFIAFVRLEDGREEKVHVLNTGRCRELLLPGSTVYLAESANTARKTAFDLVAVEKRCPDGRNLLINMDSHITNSAAEEFLFLHNLFPDLFSSLPVIKREVPFGSSRFDFLLEKDGKKLFLEVKSVTLEENKVVLFPDAPTLRGVKHLEELLQAKRKGYECAVLFVVQLKGATLFRPNDATHPQFGETLKKVYRKGVKVLVMDCRVTPDSLFLDSPLPFRL